jgi:DNA-binding transcriptional LysR family regulator
MELRVLRYFLAVADHGSVTAAAHRVRVAQPAVSRQLRALEAELGVELFVRDGRALRLGPAGRRLLPIARDLIARADSAQATMTALAHGLNVSLVVAAHATTIADVIAPFVAVRGAAHTTPVFVTAAADAA